MKTIQRSKVSDYLEQNLRSSRERDWQIYGSYTPDPVCELIEAIARIYSPKKVVDICCGTGNLLGRFGDLLVVQGIDINPEIISLAQKINPDIHFLQADTLEYDFSDIKYDLVLGSLPFGRKLPNKKSLEEQLITKGLELLDQNGIAIFVVPEGILSGDRYSKFRTDLLEKFALDIIVSLPSGNFQPYTSIQTSILVIRNSKPSNKVFMTVFDGNVEAITSNFKKTEGEFYLDVSKIDDRLDRDFYVSMKSIEENLSNHPNVRLSEISEIILGLKFEKEDFKSSGKYLVFNRKDKEGNDFVDSIKNEQCILRDNDIVLGLIGHDNVVEIYKENDSNVVIKNNYAIVRQSENTHKDLYLYLSTYLQTDQGKLLFKKAIKASLKGSSIPFLSKKSLSDITIPVIPLKELNELISKNASKLDKIQRDIKEYIDYINNKKYDEAELLVNERFNEYSEEEKEIYLNFINKEKEVQEKTRQLEAKEKELEDMMSMFAHKFRSPLDAIVYNTNHENNPKVYIEAAQTMRGLLDIFSIISTDDELLKEKLKDDMQGHGRLINVLNSTLKMSMLHLLSVSGIDKIRQHYIYYAIEHGKVENTVTPKIWYDDYDELEAFLQSEWEQSFSSLISKPFELTDQLNWIQKHFFRLEIVGFDRDDIQFKEYGVTESFFVILLNEIIINAFKYYASDTKESVKLTYRDNGKHQVIECCNPSTRSERTKSKGSGKGHTFLSALARKTNSHFVKPIHQDNFVINFAIPTQLLKTDF
jgi:hypothetical protein